MKKGIMRGTAFIKGDNLVELIYLFLKINIAYNQFSSILLH